MSRVQTEVEHVLSTEIERLRAENARLIAEAAVAETKRAEDHRKLIAAYEAAIAVPQNQHVLAELAKR